MADNVGQPEREEQSKVLAARSSAADGGYFGRSLGGGGVGCVVCVFGGYMVDGVGVGISILFHEVVTVLVNHLYKSEKDCVLGYFNGRIDGGSVILLGASQELLNKF